MTPVMNRLSVETGLIIDKTNMQAIGSAISYARRYSLLVLFGIAQSDDDGNEASGRKEPLKSAPPLTSGPPTEWHPQPVQQNSFISVTNAGDFMISFGKKYNGKKLKDISKQDCYSYIHWLTKDTNKPIDPLVMELMDAALAWYGPEQEELTNEKDVPF